MSLTLAILLNARGTDLSSQDGAHKQAGPDVLPVMFRRIDVFRICLKPGTSGGCLSNTCTSLKYHHLCQPLALRIAIGLALKTTEQPLKLV